MTVFVHKAALPSVIKMFFLIVILLFPFLIIELFAQDWQELKPGITTKRYNYVAEDKSNIDILVARIDPTVWNVRVVNVYGVLNKLKNRFPIYNIRELISLLDTEVIINGGFSAAYSLPLPAGLLVENNKVISRLNISSTTQSGVFCVAKKGNSIIHKEQYKDGECIYAVQAGPILVESPGKRVVYKNEPKKYQKYRRSIIGIDKKGKLLLITSSEANLYDLAQFLIKTESQGGLDCIAALNLSGDVESGIYMRNKDIPIVSGNVDVPIASAISISKK